jgi:hypothetical protein
MRSTKDHDILKWGAVEQPDGSYIDNISLIMWYNEAGERHREDGPAMIGTDGVMQWILNDIMYTFDEWLIKLNKNEGDKMLLRLQYA